MSVTESDARNCTNLMMNVVIIGIIAAEHLEWVEWEAVTAVIINPFHGTEHIKEDGLSEGEVSNSLRHSGTNSLEQKSLERVIVLCTKRVGYIKLMVHGMKVFVEELVRMHPAVKKILPSVQNESFAIGMRMNLENRRMNLQGEE